MTAGDASVFLFGRAMIHMYESSASGYIGALELQPHVLDFTDNAGHGILLAANNLFFQVSSTNTGAANTVRIKLLYREKYITQTELLGLVLQSNQA